MRHRTQGRLCQARMVHVLFSLLFAVPVQAFVRPRIHRPKTDLQEILQRMNDTAKRLKTITADLDYTTVTVLVNERDTETGKFYLRNPKNPEMLVEFEKPDPKTVLLKRNHLQIYYPKVNRIEEHDLSSHSGEIQQLLLLGFGTDAASLKSAYSVKLVGEEQLEGEDTAVLELTPKDPGIASQLTKIQMWVSEDSWTPAQQQFFEPSGDYLIAHYSGVKVNRSLPSSTFEIDAASGAQRVKKS
jgi:outer membrane lipoprotein-sorting protein